MSCVVVLLDVTGGAPAQEQKDQRGCDQGYSPAERPAERTPCSQEIDDLTYGHQEKKDRANPDLCAVTDQPPLGGSRFGIPTAPYRSVGHWFVTVALFPNIGYERIATVPRLPLGGRSGCSQRCILFAASWSPNQQSDVSNNNVTAPSPRLLR